MSISSSLVSATDSLRASYSSSSTGFLSSGTSISMRSPLGPASKARLWSTSIKPMTFLSASQMGAATGAIFLPKRSRRVSKAAL